VVQLPVCPRRRRGDDGASAVEFALIAPFLLLLFFGIVQYGLYFYSAQVGSNPANAAARQLSVGNCQGSGALQTFVDGQLGSAKTASATLTTTWKNVNGSTPAAPAATNVDLGGTVQLTITFPTMNLKLPFLPFMNNPTVERTVTARVEDTTDQGCGS
jgi:Flp pilus assembly protein TadG